jgi:hypothetical protein
VFAYFPEVHYFKIQTTSHQFDLPSRRSLLERSLPPFQCELCSLHKKPFLPLTKSYPSLLVLWGRNEYGKNLSDENLKAVMPSTDYDLSKAGA